MKVNTTTQKNTLPRNAKELANIVARMPEKYQYAVFSYALGLETASKATRSEGKPERVEART